MLFMTIQNANCRITFERCRIVQSIGVLLLKVRQETKRTCYHCRMIFNNINPYSSACKCTNPVWFFILWIIKNIFKNEISLVINPKIQQLNKIKRNKQTKQVLAVKKKDHHRLWKSLTLDQVVIRRRWNPFSSVGNSF